MFSEKTVITHPPANISYLDGHVMAQLFCDATYDSNLKVSFEWLKDGEMLKNTDRVYKEKKLSGPSRILFFKPLLKKDAGSYTCRVYTMDGTFNVSEDKKVGTVTVEGTT